jgi:REP element-mobilizing transposase RayT
MAILWLCDVGAGFWLKSAHRRGKLFGMARAPWNDWYHVIIHTYGSWLRGDPRGWRAVNHREHVDGDYKNPPVRGKYDRMFERSRKLMTREAVSIEAELKSVVLAAVVEKLRADELEILVASVDSKHLHLLGRFADHRPSEWVGRAKKHSSHVVRQSGVRMEAGGLWARRCGVRAIADRGHQVNVFRYIDGHRKKGAVVWRFDGRGTV